MRTCSIISLLLYYLYTYFQFELRNMFDTLYNVYIYRQSIFYCLLFLIVYMLVLLLWYFYRIALPHFIFCREWRWPDLQHPYDVTPISRCRFPYRCQSNDVCINPYHYQLPATGNMWFFMFLVSLPWYDDSVEVIECIKT